MAILIKDEEADQLIRKLAARTGESLTQAVKTAVAEQLKRAPLSAREIADRKKRIEALLARADAIPTIDHRSADEIIGYNERGLFD